MKDLGKNERFWKKIKDFGKKERFWKKSAAAGGACWHKTGMWMFAKNTAHYYSMLLQKRCPPFVHGAVRSNGRGSIKIEKRYV